MISDNEFKSWNKNFKKDYKSIISDGRYVVYKIGLLIIMARIYIMHHMSKLLSL